MTQKAKTPITTSDKLKSLNDHRNTLYALNRFKDSPQTSATAFFANNGGGPGGSTAAAGNYLETQGDTMMGPIAYFPATVLINASDELDISAGLTSTPQSSSYVIASFSSPDKIQLIKGAQFAGQQLWLQVPAASTLTMEDYSNNAGGNVVTSDGDDIVITTTTDPVTFTLIFDVTLSPNGNTGGWVILNAKSITGGSTGGIAYPIQPSVKDYSDTWSGNQTLDLTVGDGHIYKWIVDQNLTFNTTVTFPGSLVDNVQRTFELEFVHDEVGGTFTVTLPTSPSFVDEDGAVLASFTIATGRAILSCRVNEGSGGDIIVLQKNVAAAAAPSGATRELDNLTTTAINADLLFDAATYDIGDTTNFVNDFFTSQIRLQDGATVVTNKPVIVTDASDNLILNVPTGLKLLFKVANTTKWDMSSTSLTGANIILSDTFTINDSTVDPSTNGQFTRNVNDVKVWSGGALRNLSDIGVAAGGANVALSNLSTVAINTDLLFDAATHDIGDTTNPVADLFAKSVRLQTGLLTANKPSMTSLTGNSFDINHPTGSGVNFSEQGATAAVIIDGGGLVTSNNMILQNVLTLNDTTSHPGANGDLYREGSDVKIYTGGSEVNISTLGTGVPPFNDNVALVQDEVDNTKTLQFNLSLNSTGDANLITSSTTASRTWTLPDATTTLAGLATSNTFTGATNTFTNDVAFEDDVTLGLSDADSIFINGLVETDIDFDLASTIDFNGAQGAAGSLVGYIKIKHTGTDYVIPYYNVV